MYGQKMGSRNAKAVVVQNLFMLPVALQMCRSARLDVLKEHFLSADPFWPRWMVLRSFPDAVNRSDNVQPMEICSYC